MHQSFWNRGSILKNIIECLLFLKLSVVNCIDTLKKYKNMQMINATVVSYKSVQNCILRYLFGLYMLCCVVMYLGDGQAAHVWA